MKKAIFLVFILLMASCGQSSQECRASLNFWLSAGPLEKWNKMTLDEMRHSNDSKTKFLAENAKSDSIDIFDRENFLKSILSNNRVKFVSCNCFYVVEFNLSGEQNVMIKVLLAKCNNTYSIFKFKRDGSKWINTKMKEENAKRIDELLMRFFKEPSRKYYWGKNIFDVLAVTRVEGQLLKSVDFYSHLDQRQHTLIMEVME